LPVLDDERGAVSWMSSVIKTEGLAMNKNIWAYFLIEAFLIWGCANDAEMMDCGLLGVSSATIETIHTYSVKYTSYRNIEVLNTDDTVWVQDYAVWLDVIPAYVGDNTGAWSGTLMACGDAYPRLVDQIDSIAIISVFDYNDSIPAGTDMSPYFSYINEMEAATSLQSFDLLNDRLQDEFYLFLQPSVAPDMSKPVQLNIFLSFIGGKEFTLQTPSVYIRTL